MGQITRNRVMYAGTDILISDTPSWGDQTNFSNLKLLKRVQSSAISISNPVNRSRQISSSEFAFQKYTDSPDISVGINYYLTDNSNEALLGLISDGTSGIFSNFQISGGDKNLYFILTDADGQDADDITDAVGLDVFAIGNAFLDNYSLNAEVGNVPSVDLSFSCINMTFDNYAGTGSDGSQVPAINLPQGSKSTEKYLLTGDNFDLNNYLSNQSNRVSALRPGDINLQLQQPIMGGVRYSGESPANITSMQINLPIERRELLGFGSNFPYDKRIIFPVVGTIAFEGYIDEPITGDFSNIFEDENEYDLIFNFKGVDGATGFRVEIDKARVESQSFNQGVGDNLTFSSEFSFAVSATDGFRVSGSANLWADDLDAVRYLDEVNERNTTIRSGLNKFVKTLKTETIWEKVSGIYPMLGSTSRYGYNLKDPRDSDSAFRLSFSSTDTEFQNGYIEFKGDNDFANTHFNPNTDLANNDIHFSFLNLEDETVSTYDIGALKSLDGTEPRFLIHVDYSSPDGSHLDCYSTNERVTINPTYSVDSAAFFVASRPTDSLVFLNTYKESSTEAAENTSSLSTAKVNYDLYLGAANLDGTAYSSNDADRKYAFVSFGKGLSKSEADSFHTALKTFHTDIGRDTLWFKDTDALDYLNAVQENNETNRAALNTFVNSIKAAGIWSKVKAMYPMLGSTAYYGYNLKDPRDSDSAFRLTFSDPNVDINSAGYIHFNQNLDFANTHLIPSSDLSDNTVHISFISLEDTSVNSFDMGCVQREYGSEVSRLLVHVDYADDGSSHFDAFSFGNERSTISNVDSAAFYIGSRNSDTNSFLRTYKTALTSSGTQTATRTTNKPNIKFYFGAKNDPYGPSQTNADRKYGFLSLGEGLSETQSDALFQAVKTMYTSIGRHSSIFS